MVQFAKKKRKKEEKLNLRVENRENEEGYTGDIKGPSCIA